MKKLSVIVLSVFLITGCLWGDEATSYRKLTKDFWLIWFMDSTDQHLSLSTSKDGNFGSPIIKQTFFAIGFNDNFIIAKQHPDKKEEIQERLFNRDSIEGNYILADPADTMWLTGEDSVYQKTGKWYHISNGWNPSDSLKPYKKITYFHLIDIRQYERGKSNSYEVFTFDNEKDFINKRHELEVPELLSFTIVSTALE
jgi:hypothetical protein